jgi:transcriptional regulator with XRE-family HTH domain
VDSPQAAPAIFTAIELRQLRHRLGWSQAEMARCLKIDYQSVANWELGETAPSQQNHSALLGILQIAESNAGRMQRRPVAEVMMKDRGISQIHDFDVIESLDKTDNS